MLFEYRAGVGVKSFRDLLETFICLHSSRWVWRKKKLCFRMAGPTHPRENMKDGNERKREYPISDQQISYSLD